jgi:phosphate-selective porin OprO/OprP
VIGNLKRSVLAAVCGVLVLSGVPASAEVEAGWKGSTYIQDEGKGYKIQIGGRIMNDWVWNDADADLDAAVSGIENGLRFRRARLFASGTIYYNVFYKLQIDFAGGDADFKDMFVGVRDIPVLYSVLVGHQYEPAGLETITSSKYITFPERASVATLMPERNTGINAFRRWDDDRVTAALGAFQASNDYGDAAGDDWAVTGRVTVAPINEDGGRRLIHVGASGSYRNSDNGVFRIQAKPENPVIPSFLDTDSIFADTYTLFGGELAGTWGPFSVQGEVAFSRVESDSIGTPMLSAYYAQASYLLTGENRTYKYGKMNKITPRSNFDGKGGAGAWEIAARYSLLDMNDDQLMAGEFGVVTAGVNWYLNPYTRVMMHYSYTDYTDVGKMNSFVTRFQISF